MMPSLRISIIERSLRCYRSGLLSLVPLVGIVMSILAFRDGWFVSHACGLTWNPARTRMRIGIALAVLGLIISVVTICFLIYPPHNSEGDI